MGHLYNGVLLSHKKKKILPFATVWMDLENIILSKISQSEKDIGVLNGNGKNTIKIKLKQPWG